MTPTKTPSPPLAEAPQSVTEPALAPETSVPDAAPGKVGNVNPVQETLPTQTFQKLATHLDTATKQPSNAYSQFTMGLNHNWRGVVDRMRQATPASIVNNGSRIIFGVKAVADGMGIASALRPGSRSIPRLIANIPTFATLIPGALYKEEPVSKEEEESYKKMSKFQYFTTKLKQAFDPKHHIVETVAVATMWNGIFTAVSGLKQSSWSGVTARNFFDKVSSETWQGLMTLAAGAILSFKSDREKAWQQSTSIFLWRIPVKGHQAYTAYYKGYPEKNIAKGDAMQFFNFSLQQVANFFSMFFAGVKKTDDGKIIHLGKDEEKIDLTKEKIKGYEFDEKGHDLKQTHISKTDVALDIAGTVATSGAIRGISSGTRTNVARQPRAATHSERIQMEPEPSLGIARGVKA